MRIDHRSTNVARAGFLAVMLLAASLSATGWNDAAQGNPQARVVDDAARGMPAHADITDPELTALQHYIRQQAEVALRRTP